MADTNKIQTNKHDADSVGLSSDNLERVVMVAVGDISTGKHQPRSPIDESTLHDLAASIKSAGVMQPLIARRVSSGRGEGIELIAGERRWRAARLAGLEAVPVIIREIDDLAAAQWAIIENVQREDLNPIDRGMAFRNLVETFGLTQSQVAEAVGIDRSSVANLIRLTDLEPEICAWVSSGALSAGHGKALLSVASGAVRVRLAKESVENSWTVRELERRASAHSAARATPKQGTGPNATHLDSIEKQLGEYLGTKVRISANTKRTRGKITITFFGIDHFDGLLNRMGVRLES